jgi:hypothetical protein
VDREDEADRVAPGLDDVLVETRTIGTSRASGSLCCSSRATWSEFPLPVK